MSDEKDVVRGYSQDRHTYSQGTKAMLKKRTSIELYRQSDDYHSNRNCPEILSIFALQQRHLEDRKKRIYNTFSKDEHYFNMINYPLESPPVTPRPISSLESLLIEEKHATLPKITPLQTPKSESSTEENKQPNFPMFSPKENKNQSPIDGTYSNGSAKITTHLAENFPRLTSRNTSNTTTNRNAMPTFQTIMKSTPSVVNRSLNSKIPMTITENNGKGQSHHYTNTRRPH